MSLQYELKNFINEIVKEFGKNKIIGKLIIDTESFENDGDLMKFLKTFLKNEKRIKFNELYTLQDGRKLFDIIKKYETIDLNSSKILDFENKRATTYDISALANNFNVTIGMYSLIENGENSVILKATINNLEAYADKWIDKEHIFKYILMSETDRNYVERDYRHRVNRIIYHSFMMEIDLKIHLFVRDGVQKDYSYKGIYSVLSFSDDGKSIKLVNNKKIDESDLDENAKSLQSEGRSGLLSNENMCIYGAEANVKTRRFQGLFRRKLIEKYNGKCVLCDIACEDFLIASHIKPYSKCINKSESCDSENGLLLCPNHDLLFDKGFISFDKQGYLLISNSLDAKHKESLDLNLQKRIETSDKMEGYLKYHRKCVYKE